MIFSIGEVVEPIPVHLDSRIACFNSTVDIPLYSEDAIPTNIVLIAPVVPIPAGAAPLAIPTAEAYIPPVSMFDLIPGRRYIITNRRVNALHVRNQHQHNSLYQIVQTKYEIQ